LKRGRLGLLNPNQRTNSASKRQEPASVNEPAICLDSCQLDWKQDQRGFQSPAGRTRKRFADSYEVIELAQGLHWSRPLVS
jgi:hypothetical protein